MTDWFQNDELFLKELQEGHRWAERIGMLLKEKNIPVEVWPMEWRASIKDRHEFNTEQDIVVMGDIYLESKSRRLDFDTDPRTYPYATALIDTVSGWEAKPVKPKAVILTSQVTGAILVIPVAGSRKFWTVKTSRDRVRNIDESWYEVSRKYLLWFSDLVDWLKREQLDRADLGRYPEDHEAAEPGGLPN